MESEKNLTFFILDERLWFSLLRLLMRGASALHRFQCHLLLERRLGLGPLQYLWAELGGIRPGWVRWKWGLLIGHLGPRLASDWLDPASHLLDQLCGWVAGTEDGWGYVLLTVNLGSHSEKEEDAKNIFTIFVKNGWQNKTEFQRSMRLFLFLCFECKDMSEKIKLPSFLSIFIKL